MKGFAALLLIIASVPFLAYADAKKLPEIALEVATVLNAPAGTLSFTLKNNGKQNFETTPVATNYNRIVITTPDGQMIEHFVWKDWKNGLPVSVKPSEEINWKVEMPGIFEFRELHAPGLYRVRWKMDEQQSEEILLLKE